MKYDDLIVSPLLCISMDFEYRDDKSGSDIYKSYNINCS